MVFVLKERETVTRYLSPPGAGAFTPHFQLSANHQLHLHTYTIYTIYTSTPPKPQQTKNKKHTAALTPSASREL